MKSLSDRARQQQLLRGGSGALRAARDPSCAGPSGGVEAVPGAAIERDSRGQGYSRRMAQPSGSALVELAVVQPARPRGPELDRVGHDAEAGPERRPRHGVAGKFRFALADGRFERLAAVERLALARRPGADLTLARARGEVGVGLAVGHGNGAAVDAHLARERRPVDAEDHLGPRGDLAGLLAAEVREEDEAALVDVLDQHDAAPTAGRRRRPSEAGGLRIVPTARPRPRQTSRGNGRWDPAPTVSSARSARRRSPRAFARRPSCGRPDRPSRILPSGAM